MIRVALALNLLELQGTLAFQKFAQRFMAGEPVGEAHVDCLFEQLRDDPNHVGNLHPELLLLKQELEKEGAKCHVQNG